MFDHDEIAARQAALARHMAERLNALAERVFVQAEAAVEPEAVQAAALTVERLYRGVRLSMAYEARVARDHRRAARDAAAQASETRQSARTDRAQRLKHAVGQFFLADYEAERDASDALGEDPDENLRTLSRHLAAVVEAVDGAQSAIDPARDFGADFTADVTELCRAALLIARMSELAEAGPARGKPPRRAAGPQPARPTDRPPLWRGSG